MRNDNLTMLAGNAQRLRATITDRLAKLDKSLNELCEATRTGISTIWRWGQGSDPNISTLRKLETQLQKWEKQSKRRRDHS